MVKALCEQGIFAEIVTTNDSGTEVLEVPLSQRIEYQGIPVWFFPRFSPPLNSVREFAFSTALTRWLWRSIPTYDLIHIHAIFSYPSTIAMVIARHHHIPYIVRPLGQLCSWSLQQSKVKKRFYLDLIERENLNRAQAIHFTALSEQEEAKNLKLQAPGVLIPLGLDMPPSPESVSTNKTDHTLLFLSRLHPKKGVLNLLEAWNEFQPKNWKLVIAGSGDIRYIAALETVTQELDLDSTVEFLGAIEGSAKCRLYNNADLFVLPTLSENFGIVIAEALACGIPVITTRAAPWSDLITYRCGWWIDVGVVPLVRALREAVALSPMERQIMGQRGRHLIKTQYTWKRSMARMIEAYQASIDQAPIP
jgi:glycosyltransferase involved in cell wall biosynthesis